MHGKQSSRKIQKLQHSRLCSNIPLFSPLLQQLASCTATPIHSIEYWLVGHRLTTFEEEEGQSYHYSGDNQSQWKKKFYLLHLIYETFTVEYNCTVTTHQRFLIPNHFNIFYTSLPFRLDIARKTLLSLHKSLKNSTVFYPHISPIRNSGWWISMKENTYILDKVGKKYGEK